MCCKLPVKITWETADGWNKRLRGKIIIWTVWENLFGKTHFYYPSTLLWITWSCFSVLRFFWQITASLFSDGSLLFCYWSCNEVCFCVTVLWGLTCSLKTEFMKEKIISVRTTHLKIHISRPFVFPESRKQIVNSTLDRFLSVQAFLGSHSCLRLPLNVWNEAQREKLQWRASSVSLLCGCSERFQLKNLSKLLRFRKPLVMSQALFSLLLASPKNIDCVFVSVGSRHAPTSSSLWRHDVQQTVKDQRRSYSDGYRDVVVMETGRMCSISWIFNIFIIRTIWKKMWCFKIRKL